MLNIHEPFSALEIAKKNSRQANDIMIFIVAKHYIAKNLGKAEKNNMKLALEHFSEGNWTQDHAGCISTHCMSYGGHYIVSFMVNTFGISIYNGGNALNYF